jgi:uncharacterized coiled-coil protein SlyX
MDPPRTPPPSPGVSQAPTPGHPMDNEYRPGLIRTDGPEFAALGHHRDNENRTHTPEHNTSMHEMHTGFTPEEGMVDSPSADPPPLNLGPGHFTSPELNITPLEMFLRLADDQRDNIYDLNQVIANNQAELARAERRLGELNRFIRIQRISNRRLSGRRSPLSTVTTPVRHVVTTPVRPVPSIQGPPPRPRPRRRRERIESGWVQDGNKLWLQQTNTPLKL